MLRKLDLRLSSDINNLQTQLRNEFLTKLANHEHNLKKELNFLAIKNSFKRDIDESLIKRANVFSTIHTACLDEIQVIKLCRETFAEEY